MYGLVNKAVEQLVVENYGQDMWDDILDESGIDVDMFLSMEQYDDSVTYDLVAAASRVLDTSAEDILIGFGEYWTLYTAQEGYGDIMKMSGDTLPEFLTNLDNMHTRVALQYPELKPPSFKVDSISEHGLTLHYRSHRDGLAPLVIGLLNGLGKMFEVNLKIEQTSKKSDGADHDVFTLTYLESESVASQSESGDMYNANDLRAIGQSTI